MIQIDSKAFWISEWQRAADGSPFHNLYPDEKLIWDMSASTYDSGTKKNNQRVETVLEHLERMNFWRGDHPKRILDIGSGTGVFTIPLALCGGCVDALDISEKMNHVLRQKSEVYHLTDIRILHEDFRKLSLADHTYDLVIGSMNPCLYEPENFLKAMALSRDVMIYIGITSGNRPSDEKPLAELLTGRKSGHNGSNHIIYPLNLLLSMGLHPTIDYVDYQWESKEAPNPSKTKFLRQFEHLKNNVTEMEQVISDYVDRHTENGLYVQRSSGTMGIVVCQVKTQSDNGVYS